MKARNISREMMKVKVYCLVEDTQNNPNFPSEHGLSFYIETNHHRILFDVGQSDLFIRNAEKLGLDLEHVDLVIISHGHYDHGRGLDYFLSINHHAKVYIQETAFQKFLSKRNEDHFADVGISPHLKHHRQIELVRGNYQIDDELILISDLSTQKYYPKGNELLFVEKDGNLVHDDFSHEQSLLISDHQHVLFAGCAHKGIVNISLKAYDLNHHHRLDAIFGGFHLVSRFPEFKPSDQEVISIGKELLQFSRKYYTGHCTGEKAYHLLKTELGMHIEHLHPGMIFEIKSGF